MKQEFQAQEMMNIWNKMKIEKKLRNRNLIAFVQKKYEKKVLALIVKCDTTTILTTTTTKKNQNQNLAQFF